MQNPWIGISEVLFTTDALTDTQKFIYIRMLKDAVFSDEYSFRHYTLKRGQLLLTASKMKEYGSINTVTATIKKLEELEEIAVEKLNGRYHFGNGTLITFIYFDECIYDKEHYTGITQSRKIIVSNMKQSLYQNRNNHCIKNDTGTELNQEKENITILEERESAPDIKDKEERENEESLTVKLYEWYAKKKSRSDLRNNVGSLLNSDGMLSPSALDVFNFQSYNS